MKKCGSILLAGLLVWTLTVRSVPTLAVPRTEAAVTVSAPSAILIERETGTILYEKNAHEKRHPASVTKIMTMLLLMEALDAGQITMDTVFTASETAASMGGSQVYLEPGECMTLDTVLKCIAVASANDVCVMAAEHLAGSEAAFVQKMNEKAAALGMQDTHFANCTGLDAEGHETTACDISLMSRALLSHEAIRKYTGIWMDTIRNGTFGLTNTNKMVRFYAGATGLKTGFTSEAGYCISASAEKDGMELIAVIMHGENSKSRNADAAALLDYGFATYALARPDPLPVDTVPVTLGVEDQAVAVPLDAAPVLVEKSRLAQVETKWEMAQSLEAPVEAGQRLGTCRLLLDGKVLQETPIRAAEQIERLSTGEIYKMLLHRLLLRK